MAVSEQWLFPSSRSTTTSDRATAAGAYRQLCACESVCVCVLESVCVCLRAYIYIYTSGFYNIN